MSNNYRDLTAAATSAGLSLEAMLPRRKIVVVVGIDDYRSLPRLRCAVNDARGVQELLVERFGFEAPIPPLMNQAATKQAIEALIEDHLPRLLRTDDALIFFFAGHGTSRLARLDGVTEETGYLAPVEARGAEVFSDLLDMAELLRKIGRLPANHILVVLDACHSGIALGTAVSQHRSLGAFVHRLVGNRSRRAITSARRDELALDSGPVPGHSLFTGTLIKAMTSGEADVDHNGVITFSELALFLQQQVGQASGSRQTPDYGAFHLDDRGELVLAMRFTAPGRPVTWGPAPWVAQAPSAGPARRRWGLALGIAAAFGIMGLGIAFAASFLAGGKLASSPPADPCPEGMALIPGGPFIMGSNQGDLDEQPIHQAQVATFCMDKLEVTVADYEACIKGQSCEDPRRGIELEKTDPLADSFSRNCNWGKPERRTHPINCLGFSWADMYCRRLGKRLPTEAEWEYAARGGAEQRTYPWGEQHPVRERLNACGPECREDVARHADKGGPRPTTTIMYVDRDDWPTTSPVGAFPLGASRWGVQDMGGNVYEWTSTTYCPYGKSACTGFDLVYRGGSWGSVDSTDIRTSKREHGSRNNFGTGIGWRCASGVGGAGNDSPKATPTQPREEKRAPRPRRPKGALLRATRRAHPRRSSPRMTRRLRHSGR